MIMAGDLKLTEVSLAPLDAEKYGQLDAGYADELVRVLMRLIHAQGPGVGSQGGSRVRTLFLDEFTERTQGARAPWGASPRVFPLGDLPWVSARGIPQGGPQKFWVDSELILCRFWIDSSLILRRFWSDGGPILC